MESIVRKMRKAVIIIGCIAILLSAVNSAVNIMVAYYAMRFQTGLMIMFTVVNPLTTHLTTFLYQACIALVLISIAFWIDPAKVTPAFGDNKRHDYEKGN